MQPLPSVTPNSLLHQDHQTHDPKLWIGMLSQRTRRIRIVNMLTKDEHTLEVRGAAICPPPGAALSAGCANPVLGPS